MRGGRATFAKKARSKRTVDEGGIRRRFIAGKGMRLNMFETSRRENALDRPKAGRNHPHEKRG